MSKNVIFCYSGTGNCLDMAKNIAKALDETDMIMMRSMPAVTDVALDAAWCSTDRNKRLKLYVLSAYFCLSLCFYLRTKFKTRMLLYIRMFTNCSREN